MAFECAAVWQEVGEATPKANMASPSAAFTKRSSAAISELEPLAEVDGEGEAGNASEDPDAPDKGEHQGCPYLEFSVPSTW